MPASCTFASCVYEVLSQRSRVGIDKKFKAKKLWKRARRTSNVAASGLIGLNGPANAARAAGRLGYGRMVTRFFRVTVLKVFSTPGYTGGARDGGALAGPKPSQGLKFNIVASCMAVESKVHGRTFPLAPQSFKPGCSGSGATQSSYAYLIFFDTGSPQLKTYDSILLTRSPNFTKRNFLEP